MKVSKTWHGLQLLERIDRASGRALVGIGVEVSNETKGITHVQEGTLRRSVHAAPPSADHAQDEAGATTADLAMFSMNVEPEHGAFGPVVEVGSWLEYACVEWVGRGHPGVTQGLESVRGMKADGIVAQAFAEEGLRGR